MSKNKRTNTILIIILGAGLLLRLILGYSYPPYPETMKDWAQRIVETGFAHFYGPEVQWPYPPLYLYILWVLGLILKVFNISDPGLRELIIELPPIICDIAGACLIWHVASKRLDDKKALIFTAAYTFNPALIHNSSMWGQTDAVFTLAVALMCVFLCEKKLPQAFICFGAGLMLKQQTLTFAPVLMVAVFEQVFPADHGDGSAVEKHRFFNRRTVPVIGWGMAVIAAMLLISLPFGLGEMLKQYLSVQSGMPYVSVGAYNFWMLVNRGWCSMDTTFIGIPCGTWGKLAIIGITLLCFILAFLYRKDEKKYPLLGASLILPVFCFATGMHERYMLSGLILLALAYIYKPSKSLLAFYICFSLLQLANTVFVYGFALQDGFSALAGIQERIEKLFSFGDFAATVCFVICLFIGGLRENKTEKRQQ